MIAESICSTLVCWPIA